MRPDEVVVLHYHSFYFLVNSEISMAAALMVYVHLLQMATSHRECQKALHAHLFLNLHFCREFELFIKALKRVYSTSPFSRRK